MNKIGELDVSSIGSKKYNETKRSFFEKVSEFNDP